MEFEAAENQRTLTFDDLNGDCGIFAPQIPAISAEANVHASAANSTALSAVEEDVAIERAFDHAARLALLARVHPAAWHPGLQFLSGIYVFWTPSSGFLYVGDITIVSFAHFEVFTLVPFSYYMVLQALKMTVFRAGRIRDKVLLLASQPLTTRRECITMRYAKEQKILQLDINTGLYPFVLSPSSEASRGINAQICL